MIIQCLLGKDICGFLDEDYRILNTYSEKSEFNVNNVYKYLDECEQSYLPQDLKERVKKILPL